MIRKRLLLMCVRWLRRLRNWIDWWIVGGYDNKEVHGFLFRAQVKLLKMSIGRGGW